MIIGRVTKEVLTEWFILDMLNSEGESVNFQKQSPKLEN